MITVGVTPSNDGYARTGGINGTGLFATAATNIGASGQLTAQVALSNSTMPLAAPCAARYGHIRFLSCHGRIETVSKFRCSSGGVCKTPSHTRPRSAKLKLRARGHSHARALRSVVDRLLYVACAILEKGTLFDPSFAEKKNAAA